MDKFENKIGKKGVKRNIQMNVKYIKITMLSFCVKHLA